MSANRFTFDGLAELRAELRALPASLTAEATHIVEGAANGAAATIKAGYPVVTGNLRDGLIVKVQPEGQFAASVVVVNTSPHAWLYDNGSQARHWASGKSTGTMFAVDGPRPPQHLFVGTVIDKRRQMYAQLKDLLVRNGLTVSGDA